MTDKIEQPADACVPPCVDSISRQAPSRNHNEGSAHGEFATTCGTRPRAQSSGIHRPARGGTVARKAGLLSLAISLAFSCILSPARPAPAANDSVKAAVLDLKQTALTKIDYDIDTTATAFADARNINSSLCWYDIFNAPLTIIEGGITDIESVLDLLTLGSPASITSKFKAAQDYSSMLMTLAQTYEALNELQIALTGPEYSSLISSMLTEADSTIPCVLCYCEVADNIAAYKQSIIATLNASSGTPVLVPRRSLSVGLPNAENIPGASGVKTRIQLELNGLLQDVDVMNLSAGRSADFVSLITQVSRGLAVSEINGTSISYSTYALNGMEWRPVSGVLRVGDIASLEQGRKTVLGNEDAYLQIEQYETVQAAAEAEWGATKLWLEQTTLDPGTKTVLDVADQVVYWPDAVTFVADHTVTKNPGDFLKKIPEDMTVSLSQEMSATLLAVDAISEYVEVLGGGHFQALSTGIAQGDSVGQYYWRYYAVTVPPGATLLTVTTTDASGDVDLWAKFGEAPTATSADCYAITDSGNETCSVLSPRAGTWFVGVRGYGAGRSSYTLTATYTTMPIDMAAPTVAITSPIGGTVSSVLNITADANDDVGVTHVDFFVDGSFLSRDSSRPYVSASWDTRTVSNGTHTLTAKAYDAAGHVTPSAPVTVTVSNTTPDTTPATISQIHPSTTISTATITWRTDEPADTQVEYGLTSCPCGTLSSLSATRVTSHSVTLTGLSPGTTYYFRARSRDAAGNLGTSPSTPPSTFTTTSAPSAPPNLAPRVALSEPNGGEAYQVGTAHIIKWTATDDVAVASIALYYSTDGGVSWISIQGSLANTGQYTWVVPNVSSSTMKVRVVAADGAGLTGEASSYLNFTIYQDCVAPGAPTLQPIGTNSGYYTVSWNSMSPITGYALEEDTSPSFTNATRWDLTAGTTSRFFGGKSPGTYYYRVRAENVCGDGTPSQVQAATVVINPTLGSISAVSPPDQAVNQPRSVNLCWQIVNPSGVAVSYDVYVVPADTQTFFANNLKSAGQTSTCYAVSNLPWNTRVSWGIVAHDQFNNERSSSMFHFTTVGDTTPPTGSISITGNTGSTSTTQTYSVTLNLTASDVGSGVASMSFSNDNIHWAGAYFAPTFAWNLADPEYGGTYGQASYTVYAKFWDNQGNPSTTYTATIQKVTGQPGNVILKGIYYETIDDALNAAVSGDIVYLTDGYYSIDGGPSSLRPWDSSRNVGLVMRPGVTLMGAGASRTTIEFTNSYYGLVDAANATIAGLTLINSSSSGTLRSDVLLESTGSTVRDCVLRGSYYGIDTEYDSTHAAVKSRIFNNVVSGNAEGIFVAWDARGVSLWNNTIVYNTGGYWGIAWAGTPSFDAANNIVAFNSYGMGGPSGPTITIRYNDVYNRDASGNSVDYSQIPSQTGLNHNISADPSFVNGPGGDYHLQSGSPAIDKGINVGLPYASLAPDMGAFESGASGTIQVSTNRSDATFKVVGPQTTYSGSGTSWSASGVPIGLYSVTFAAVGDYYTPAYQAAILSAGQTLTFTGTYVLDTVGPTGTLAVNFEEYATASPIVTLTLDIADAVAGLGSGAQMQFSNDGASWSPPEPYSSLRKDWDLTLYGGNATPGTKTVRAMVSDALGNWTTFTHDILFVPNRQTVEVPAEYATIQAALNAAQPGDIVHLAPQTYSESVTVPSGVRLQGSGADKTLFIGGATVTLTANSQVDGLGGYWIAHVQAGPAIVSNCVFRTYNGVQATAVAAIVRNNVFYGSSVNVGVSVGVSSTIKAENNTFVGVEWAFYINSNVDTKVYGRNNIFAFNTIAVDDPPASDPSHQHFFGLFNDYWSNTGGDFAPSSNTTLKLEGGDLKQDPLFADRAAADYHLQSTSPAVDSGHPDARYNDVDGSRNDRGAYGGPRANTAPIADFIISPATGGADAVFTLDASPSADRESDSSTL